MFELFGWKSIFGEIGCINYLLNLHTFRFAYYSGHYKIISPLHNLVGTSANASAIFPLVLLPMYITHVLSKGKAD